LVDCSGTAGNEGCNGGWPSWALDYLDENGGLASESSYAYTARDGACNYSPSIATVSVSGGPILVDQADEDALKEALFTLGPIAIAF